MAAMPLKNRGQALEEEFFKRQDQEKIEAMAEVKRVDGERRDLKAALRDASGMTDEEWAELSAF